MKSIAKRNKLMDKQKVKSIIESLLFINERPIEMNELLQVVEATKKEVELALDELKEEYAQRQSGICIVKVAGGYQMCSCPENETWVKKMYQERTKQKLSVASLETLAIIAYKQPITRVEVEAIRGVNVDGVAKKLTDSGLIKIGGRKDVVGRPFLYITTRKFLEYFGINSLKDLPKLEDFVALAGKDTAIVEDKEKVESNNEVSEPIVDPAN
ncbi:MAG: SMC-Scp complex subunit ScpB [Candidatus Omnitrophica bacterium]|nr:SMC-Scp complex subunit ScpB [Candidatus Omnitrophota bacterium]